MNISVNNYSAQLEVKFQFITDSKPIAESPLFIR